MREVDLHVTNRCNLRCSHCIVNAGRDIFPEMTTAELMQLFRYFASKGCREVHFTGGEPLLRADILSLLRGVFALSMRAVVQSNGILLSDEVLQELKQTGLDRLVVSLDGLRESNDNMRRRLGGFDASLAAIDRSVRNGLHVRVTTAADRRNLQDILELVKILADIGVDKYSVNYATPMLDGEFDGEAFVGPTEWQAFCRDLEVKAVALDVTYEPAYVDVADFSRFGTFSCNCRVFKDEWFLVRCDGEVFPCDLFFHDVRFSLGNVLRESLSDVFRTPGESYVRKCMGVVDSSPCPECELGAVCGGGCLGYRVRNPHGRDMRCDRTGAKTIPICPFVKVRTKSGTAGNVTPYG